MTDKNANPAGGCPFSGANTSVGARSNQDWWAEPHSI